MMSAASVSVSYVKYGIVRRSDENPSGLPHIKVKQQLDSTIMEGICRLVIIWFVMLQTLTLVPKIFQLLEW